MSSWKELKFWDSGEHQVIQERLEDLLAIKKTFNPTKDKLYAALDATPFDKVKVVIIGQDPYPDQSVSTGLAFDIPKGKRKFPITLQTLFKEYCDDLHHPYPLSGSLRKWTEQGVLLWNAIPTCETNKSLSHYGWFEWHFLTKEIIEYLCSHKEKGVVFCFLGSVPKEFSKYVTEPSKCFFTSHPSPRGNMSSKTPFLGSRMFTTVNDYLNQLELGPIDWRL